jgi:hypothetical protein
MPVDNMVVAVFNTHRGVEDAVQALQKAGYDTRNVSVAGKDHDTGEQLLACYNSGGRVLDRGKYGGFWGTMWQMLSGSACFDMPRIGPVLVAGPLAARVFEALSGASMVGGLSTVGAGLYSVGIPEASILEYESALQADKLLVLAHGEPDEVDRARATLDRTSPAALDVHDTFNPGPVAEGLEMAATL